MLCLGSSEVWAWDASFSTGSGSLLGHLVGTACHRMDAAAANSKEQWTADQMMTECLSLIWRYKFSLLPVSNGRWSLILNQWNLLKQKLILSDYPNIRTEFTDRFANIFCRFFFCLFLIKVDHLSSKLKLVYFV